MCLSAIYGAIIVFQIDQYHWIEVGKNGKCTKLSKKNETK